MPLSAASNSECGKSLQFSDCGKSLQFSDCVKRIQNSDCFNYCCCCLNHHREPSKQVLIHPYLTSMISLQEILGLCRWWKASNQSLALPRAASSFTIDKDQISLVASNFGCFCGNSDLQFWECWLLFNFEILLPLNFHSQPQYFFFSLEKNRVVHFFSQKKLGLSTKFLSLLL